MFGVGSESSGHRELRPAAISFDKNLYNKEYFPVFPFTTEDFPVIKSYTTKH